MSTLDFAEPADTAGERDNLHLIYKIEGRPNEVDIFELSRVLEALGEVLKEGNTLLDPESELVLKVRPFEPGSFVMDIGMYVQQNPEYCGGIFALLAQPDFASQAKQVLEYIGFIKKAGEIGTSLLELLRKLRNGKPEKIERRGDTFEYHAVDGGIIPVSAPVHNLYNSGVVNNYIVNIAVPVERPEVAGVKTFLKDMESDTGVQITKEDVLAIRAYAEPPAGDGKAEVLENTSVYMLHPKSGNYGETTGQWTFKIAGTSRTLKAKITDPTFLASYTNGVIRFYAQDLLKARVHGKQVVEGSRVKVQNEISEVLEYRQAHPSVRR